MDIQLHVPYLQLRSNIQLRGVKDEEDELGPVNEPLTHFVEGVASLLLLLVFDDTWGVYQGNLLQQAGGQLQPLETLQEVLGEHQQQAVLLLPGGTPATGGVVTT